MGLLSNLLFGKPRQGYPLKPIVATCPRQISETSFNEWVREFKVGSLFNHEESQETCERLKILKFQRGLLKKELSHILTNPPKSILTEGRS